MQNKFDGWVPVTIENGKVFYGKNGQDSQWDSPFPGWVLNHDINGILNAVHAATNKKVYSFRDLEAENLIINQEANQRLQEQKDAAERVALHAQYRTDPARRVEHEYEPDVNPFPENGMDVRLRRVQQSGKIIWVPGGLTTWSVYLRNPKFKDGGMPNKPYQEIITKTRAGGINLMRNDGDIYSGKYELVCGIMNVADIRVFLPDMLSADVAATLKIAIDEASRAYTAAHAKATSNSRYVDNYYNAAKEKAVAAANIALAGWVPAHPYQTFAYLDFMYGRGTRDELTYFVPSSQGDDLQELTAKGYRRIKMLNGDDYRPGVNGAITITMLMRDNGSIYYRNEDGEEVLMSCTPFERETKYMQPKQLPAVAPSHQGCWSFCRQSNKVKPEGGRNRNKRRNRKQRTIKKHKNNKHNKHNKHKKRSIQQQSTR